MDADLIIRGLRAITDFEYELQMSQTNHKLEPNVETMFLTTSIEYSYLSSTTVKEIAAFGGDLSQFVPEAVAVELRKKMSTKGAVLSRLSKRSRSTSTEIVNSSRCLRLRSSLTRSILTNFLESSV